MNMSNSGRCVEKVLVWV